MKMRNYQFYLTIMLIFLFCFSVMNLGMANEQVTLYSEDFSAGDMGWSYFNSANNDWSVGSPPFGDHTSGVGDALGTTMLTDYHDGFDEQIEASMPIVDLSDPDLINIKLSFYHWYNFSDSLNDGGGIYFFNGGDWINPLNDFPSAISGDSSVNIITGLAYSGHPTEKGWGLNSAGIWLEVIIDISQIGLSNSDFQINFVFGQKILDAQNGEGWYIDDIVIKAEKESASPPNWIGIIIIGGILGGIIVGGYYIYRKKSTVRLGKDETPSIVEKTPTATPTDKIPSPTTTDKTGSPTSTPISTKPPVVKWHRRMGDYESDNPLHNDGYYYEIYFEIPCTITPKPDEVVIAHVVFTITVKCKNGTHTMTYDYWEAFTLHDPKDDKTTTIDKHFVERGDLESAILRNTPCDIIESYTVTREHTINLGTVNGASWNEHIDGGSFAYLKEGPPPDKKKSTPSSRPGTSVQGNVTSFSEEGATKFTGTYTCNVQTGQQTYTSSLNPGTTHKLP